MKITFISDTHTKHRFCEHALPGGDILIHSGDLMNSGWSKREVIEFLDWFSEQLYEHKIFIAGNHDRIFEMNPEWVWDREIIQTQSHLSGRRMDRDKWGKNLRDTLAT